MLMQYITSLLNPDSRSCQESWFGLASFISGVAAGIIGISGVGASLFFTPLGNLSAIDCFTE